MRGSTTAILQPNGTLKTGYEYDEFGNLEQSGDTGFLNDVTFTGSVSDMSTGLQYMNSRFYNPGTGRFLSQDTYSGNPYDPWTQHLYSYCGNNPTSMIDPTGHFWAIPLEKAVEALIALMIAIFGGYVIGDAITNNKTNYGPGPVPGPHPQEEAPKANEKAASKPAETVIGGDGTIALPRPNDSPIKKFIDNTKPKTAEQEIAGEDTIPKVPPRENNYWSADLVSGSVVTHWGIPLNYRGALNRVYTGGNLMCSTNGAAYAIVKNFSNYVGPEVGRGEGFLYHYHPNRNSDIHIWYLY